MDDDNSRRAREMRALPATVREASIAAAGNVIDARQRIREREILSLRFVGKGDDCA